MTSKFAVANMPVTVTTAIVRKYSISALNFWEMDDFNEDSFFEKKLFVGKMHSLRLLIEQK